MLYLKGNGDINMISEKDVLVNMINSRLRNKFPELSSLSAEEINKIISLYEEAIKEPGFELYGDGPWHYLYFGDAIIIEECIYNVIKLESKYEVLANRIVDSYKQELDLKLERTVYSYGEPTDETCKAPYSELPKYSLTLLEMCTRRMDNTLTSHTVYNNEVLFALQKDVAIYEQVKDDLTKKDIKTPVSYEDVYKDAKEIIGLIEDSIKRRNADESFNVQEDVKTEQELYDSNYRVFPDIYKQINRLQDEETKKKEEIVNQIIMSINPKELEYAPLPDLKRRLMDLSPEHLNIILNEFAPQADTMQGSGGPQM